MGETLIEEDFACVDDYPEHDYEVTGEDDDTVTYVCRRCGAELWEDKPRDS